MNLDFIARSRWRLVLRRARLFARIHRPHQLIHAESYWVDLKVPRFDIVWAGEPASRAHAQLIATYFHERDEWLWGFENDSVPPVSYQELKAAMDQVPELAELLAVRKWSLEEHKALDLADWIAERTGYEAMYPALAGDMPTTAFLALNFTEHHGKPAASSDLWCIVCGQMPSRLGGHTMFSGPGGRALCSGCVKNAFHCLEDQEAEVPGLLAQDPGDQPHGQGHDDYVCAFCERRRPRVYLPETALCWWCIDAIRKVMRGAAGAH